MPTDHNRLDLASLRARFDASRGKEYWRCLEELADTEEFQEFLHREFPKQASEWNDPVGRRKFLQLMGASLALAGLNACARQPVEQIVPYVRQPEELALGKPLFFATAMPLGGVGSGLLVESHEGRPTKIEGNPQHPASLGATDVFAQASVLGLYDPDRAQAVTNIGDIRSWSAFLGAFRPSLQAQRALKGAGLRILTGAVTSPTLADQLGELLREMPSARWIQYEPASGDGARAGALLAFGAPVNTICHFDKADVILSLDSDFLTCGPASLRYVRDFISKRRLEAGKTEMNRLYVVESTPSNTGSKADHRLPLCPSEIEVFARAVAARLGVPGISEPVKKSEPRPSWSGPSQESPLAYARGSVFPHTLSGTQGTQAADEKWVAAVARDLQQHRGSSVVIAGDYQSPVLHALAHAMNHALGNVGKTVSYTDPVEADSVDQIGSLRQLVKDMEAGQVDLLVIIGSNPVYSVPADLNFAERILKVPLRVHISLYYDETSELCHWHIPEAHFLESWSDLRAYDGTVSIVQPLIAPLYNGKTAHELLAAFTDRPERTSYEIVRDYWKARMGAAGQAPATMSAAGADSQSTPALAEFEKFWRKALHDGVVPGTALPQKSVSLKTDWVVQSVTPGSHLSGAGDQFEIIFKPDPTVYDGQFANNGWLQELPKPVTKLTWDNAVLISPATAQHLGLSHEVAWQGGENGQVLADVVELQFQGRKMQAPAWITPGHANDCVTVHLGYGRKRAGRVGTGAGFSANTIRTSDSLWCGSGLSVTKTAGRYRLACTQYHHNIEGRTLIRSNTLAGYKKDPQFAQQEFPDPLKTPSLYPGYEYKDYAWGMAIDLNSCVGCNACVVACQSENNIPIVGKEQVMRGREMHWLRIDQYHKGERDNPETYYQPVLCQHCEHAPCEVVCPVQATTHSPEGLNTMVYNRCVGTRYCSNNCPYKVRRFNFLQFADWETPSLKLLSNPDVSVRSRGVMEKCTYCVQRINHAKINAERENRQVHDGEIVTACQAVCPAEAIVFGNINDPASRVAKLKAEPRNYGLLAELNTRPRTTYLAAVRNPNPELEKT